MHAHIFLLALAVNALTGCSPSRGDLPATSKSAYAGEERRTIKTLSETDIEDLVAGRGWGLARAAELNGVPGPLHVLELAHELGLTDPQRDAVSSVYEAMKKEAVAVGRRFIEAERRLGDAFASRDVSADTLEALVVASSRERARLRQAHLVAHLRTEPILTAAQRARYSELRGYGSGEPCGAVPSGHDPTMWRAHHGCD